MCEQKYQLPLESYLHVIITCTICVSELTGWVADALRLIAVSRQGLSQSEVLALLSRLGYHGSNQVTSLQWAMFQTAAMDSLVERPGGLIVFFHQHFKEAVQHTLFGENMHQYS